MKLSLFRFLVILFIIIIVFFIYYHFKNKNDILPRAKIQNYEGFIDFQNNISTNTFVIIPQYSSNGAVLKLYDNIYYDNLNGNLIEVDGLEVSGNTDDTNGSTIQNLYVTTRDDPTNVNTYSINGLTTNTNISKNYNQTVSNSYVAFSYQNQCIYSSQSVTFYTAWQDITCINVFSNTTNLHGNNNTPLVAINLLQNFLCIPGSAPQYAYIETEDFIDNSVPYYNDTDPNNNSFVIQPLYSPSVQVYQISHFVCFDITTGYLIMINGDVNSNITVFDSNGDQVRTNTPSDALLSSTNNNVLYNGGTRGRRNVGNTNSGMIYPPNSNSQNTYTDSSTIPVVGCPVATTSSPQPTCPPRNNNINLSIDPINIAAMFGNILKPVLSSLAESANNIPTIPPVTTPPDYRANFATACNKVNPVISYDTAYQLASQIYNYDVSYYSKNAALGTFEGNLYGIQQAAAESVNQTSSSNAVTETISSTPSTSVLQTAANKVVTKSPDVILTAAAANIVTTSPTVNRLYECFAALYAWGYYHQNSVTISSYINCYVKTYNWALSNLTSLNIQTSISTSYEFGMNDFSKIGLSSVINSTDNSIPSFVNIDDIYAALYTWGYINSSSAYTSATTSQITDMVSFTDFYNKAITYFSNSGKALTDLKMAYINGSNDNNSIFTKSTNASVSKTSSSNATIQGFTSSSSVFDPFMVIDNFGQNVVIYNQISATDTVIILGGYSDATNQVFEIINAVRFTTDGVDIGTTYSNGNSASMYSDPNICLNPYKMVNSNDYILKTQIVPSMYNTACSVCNGNDTGSGCPKCGGNGTIGLDNCSTQNTDVLVNGQADSNEQQLLQNAQNQIINDAYGTANTNVSNVDTPIVNNSSNDFLPLLDDFSKFGR
jgi:hypothetical protein